MIQGHKSFLRWGCNTGDLQEVDGSHFHVFEIPEDCNNLSDLTQRLIPTYDIASGKGYRYYVSGEPVFPEEKILLLDKVCNNMILTVPS